MTTLEKCLRNKDESSSLRPHFSPMSEGGHSGWVWSGQKNGPMDNSVCVWLYSEVECVMWNPRGRFVYVVL